MFDLLTWSFLAGALTARIGGAICFTKAAQLKGPSLVRYFILGNVIGLFYPVCMTAALRGNHPNLIYATMAGIGGIVFVVVIDRVFSTRLTLRQWLAMALIVIATCVLQFGSSSS